ncbi:MAG: sugar ABC transporter ATP-binding protein [Chloroflexota bacterium]
MAKAVTIERTHSWSATRARRHWLAKHALQQLVPRVLLALLCGYYLLPFYWMLVNALKSNRELSLYPPTWFPHQIEWSNFSRAVEVFPFWRFLGNTSILTLFTVIGVALTNPIVAYGFSRIEWPGRNALFYLVLATVFIPYPALIVALFDIFARLHWVNTFKPLIVPFFFCFIPSPFWIFLLRQFFLRIPQEISDAARLDGASELRILFQIIMPQSWPALSAVSLFAALHAWNDFLGPLLYLQDPSKYTLSIGLTFFQSQSRYDIQFNLLMAASVLVILPVVVIFLSFQRAFVEGVTVGSFK